MMVAVNNFGIAILSFVAITGCGVEHPSSDRADDDPLGAPGDERMMSLKDGKADGLFEGIEVTHGMRWLAERSEPELAHLFSNGTAETVPEGRARQQPLVGHFPMRLLPVVQALFRGTYWEHEPTTDDNGMPHFTVYSEYLSAHDPLRAPYGGIGSWGRMGDQHPSSGAAPPHGSSYPHWASPYWNPISIDNADSLFVDYQTEPMPILNRAIDEFREMDGSGCPGLYLVRTHYLQSTWLEIWRYLFYITTDFGPEDRECSLDHLLE